MKTLDSYIGMDSFTVLVDDSPELRALAEKARDLRGLSFEEKLNATKALVLEAMVNAYELMFSHPDAEKRKVYKNLVEQEHPLSKALELNAGCCKYQGALFLVLGYEADLGDKHFIQAAALPDLYTVFNDVIHDGQLIHVSTFIESLNDKKYDYTRDHPHVFEHPENIPGYKFYSYHRTGSGLILVSNEGRHVKEI